MNVTKLIEFLRARLPIVVRICAVILVGLVVLDAIPGLIGKDQAHTKLEHLPGFWAMFGFLGCVLLVLGSKLLGQTGIVRREDYYERIAHHDSNEARK